MEGITRKISMKRILGDDLLMEKVLVVYYSRSGKTREVAEYIKDLLKGDIEEVISLRNRDGFWGILISIYESLFRKRTPIKNVEKDPSSYDLVIIGTPIWAGNLSSPIRTYISKFRDRLKKVIVFYTYSLKREENSERNPAKIIEDELKKMGVFVREIISIHEEEVENGSFKEKLKWKED